jgi:hypothetical protein
MSSACGNDMGEIAKFPIVSTVLVERTGEFDFLFVPIFLLFSFTAFMMAVLCPLRISGK